MSIPVSGPGTGIFVERTTYKMISTNAVVAGDLVVVDGTVGTNVVFDTVKQPATADLDHGIFAVALETVATAGTGLFLFRGIVDGQTTGTPAVGAALAAANGADTFAASSTTNKILGFALVTGTTTPTSILFNGIEGFGNDA